MDFQTIKETQQRANNDLRALVSLEQIASEFYINDIDDPMLYAMFKVVNNDKLTKNEIIQLDDTIETLIKKQRKIDGYNLSVCVNENVPR